MLDVERRVEQRVVLKVVAHRARRLIFDAVGDALVAGRFGCRGRLEPGSSRRAPSSTSRSTASPRPLGSTPGACAVSVAASAPRPRTSTPAISSSTPPSPCAQLESSSSSFRNRVLSAPWGESCSAGADGRQPFFDGRSRRHAELDQGPDERAVRHRGGPLRQKVALATANSRQNERGDVAPGASADPADRRTLARLDGRPGCSTSPRTRCRASIEANTCPGSTCSSAG